MLLSLDPTISHSAITSHTAIRFSRSSLFFSSIVCGSGRFVNAATTFQKRFWDVHRKTVVPLISPMESFRESIFCCLYRRPAQIHAAVSDIPDFSFLFFKILPVFVLFEARHASVRPPIRSAASRLPRSVPALPLWMLMIVCATMIKYARLIIVRTPLKDSAYVSMRTPSKNALRASDVRSVQSYRPPSLPS